ncbi:hypothetical protein [Uliginosibacterium aquaticum]|uniref:Uncharacterized protein n=1 Tax=Uliginosibacterium aquaticum TaxID=2731212 RepID=A0ABX2ID03_9RHOO|nr:hypothetical protein [Uliginosibacterium aquaticum]NSL53902.1 hypothetical protein [Uliginosibacterium aquaticum]
MLIERDMSEFSWSHEEPREDDSPAALAAVPEPLAALLALQLLTVTPPT